MLIILFMNNIITFHTYKYHYGQRKNIFSIYFFFLKERKRNIFTNFAIIDGYSIL